MLQHVIARSAATWQSVTPAAGHDRKQYFGRIRKSATDLPKVVPTCQVSLRGERIATPVCALVRNDKFGRYARGRAVVQCTTSQPRDADCRTSAIQATHPSPWLFRRKSQVLILSAASPSPGRTGAARVHFALVRNDMQKTGRCLRVQGPPPLVIARSGATGQSASPRKNGPAQPLLRRSMEKKFGICLYRRVSRAAFRSALVLVNRSSWGTSSRQTKMAVKPPLYRQKPPCMAGTLVTRA